MGVQRFLAVLFPVVAGCAALPAPFDPQPATIESFRADAARCDPDRPICEARVNHVEGKPVSFASTSVEVAPGKRVLGLFCKLNPSIMTGDAQSFQREVEIVLAPGSRYRVAAAMQPHPCSMTLIDEATGAPVGKVR